MGLCLFGALGFASEGAEVVEDFGRQRRQTDLGIQLRPSFVDGATAALKPNG